LYYARRAVGNFNSLNRKSQEGGFSLNLRPGGYVLTPKLLKLIKFLRSYSKYKKRKFLRRSVYIRPMKGQCDNYNLKSHRRCNNMARMNLSGYVGHVIYL